MQINDERMLRLRIQFLRAKEHPLEAALPFKLVPLAGDVRRIRSGNGRRRSRGFRFRLVRCRLRIRLRGCLGFHKLLILRRELGQFQSERLPAGLLQCHRRLRRRNEIRLQLASVGGSPGSRPERQNEKKQESERGE